MRTVRLFPILLVLIVAVNVIAGCFGTIIPYGLTNVVAWALTILLLIGCFAVIGLLPTGTPPISDWRGVLIDQRNKISLSRFQLVLWSLLVISAIVTEGTINAFSGQCNPLGLAIPNELWILLGLSGGTAVAAPVVLAAKSAAGTLATKAASAHTWADMFYGDETGNSDQVDFSKVQQFFLTVVVILVYAVEIGAILLHPEKCATCTAAADKTAGAAAGNICNAVATLHFPSLSPGILAIIAVSQVAYIAYKAAPQTQINAPS
jgi:hypothetical protein